MFQSATVEKVEREKEKEPDVKTTPAPSPDRHVKVFSLFRFSPLATPSKLNRVSFSQILL